MSSAAIAERTPTVSEAAATSGKVTRSFREIVKTEAGEKRGEMAYFTAGRLQPFGHNKRDWTDPANIAVIKQFAAMIDVTSTNPADHIREPLVVLPTTADGPLLIDAGETRWRAVLYVEGGEYAPGMRNLNPQVPPGTIKIPCVRGDPDRSFADRLASTVTQGRSLSDLELAEVFHQMHLPKEEGGEGLTQSEIAERICKPGKQNYVSQIMALRNDKVDPRVRSALAAGRLATTTVVNTYRDFKDQPEEATRILLDEVKKTEDAEKREAEAGTSGRKGGRVARPKRVTQRQIGEASGKSVLVTRAPRAHTKVNFDTFQQAIIFEARYSSDKNTRANMNKTLRQVGFPNEPCLVDENGDELPNIDQILERHQKALRRKAAA